MSNSNRHCQSIDWAISGGVLARRLEVFVPHRGVVGSRRVVSGSVLNVVGSVIGVVVCLVGVRVSARGVFGSGGNGSGRDEIMSGIWPGVSVRHLDVVAIADGYIAQGDGYFLGAAVSRNGTVEDTDEAVGVVCFVGAHVPGAGGVVWHLEALVGRGVWVDGIAAVQQPVAG